MNAKDEEELEELIKQMEELEKSEPHGNELSSDFDDLFSYKGAPCYYS